MQKTYSLGTAITSIEKNTSITEEEQIKNLSVYMTQHLRKIIGLIRLRRWQDIEYKAEHEKC